MSSTPIDAKPPAEQLARLRVKLGEAYLLKNDVNGAMGQATLVLADAASPVRAAAYLLKGKTHMAQKSWGEAAGVLTRFRGGGEKYVNAGPVTEEGLVTLLRPTPLHVWSLSAFGDAEGERLGSRPVTSSGHECSLLVIRWVVVQRGTLPRPSDNVGDYSGWMRRPCMEPVATPAAARLACWMTMNRPSSSRRASFPLAADTTLQQMAGAGMDWESEAPEIWPGWSATDVIIAEPGAPYGNAESSPSGWRPMGQIGNTYLAANGPEGLLLLDQHATHESMLYAALMRADQGPFELPEPLVLTLTAEQARWLQAIEPMLTTLGFETEPFGRSTLLVRNVPRVLADLLQAPQLLAALQEARQRLTAQASPEVVREQLCAALSCRTAIRAGDVLSDDQAARLVDAVGRRQVPYTCPHGRPTYVALTMADLERRFLRSAILILNAHSEHKGIV